MVDAGLSKENVSGAVMVVGGGISGMQSALDLAESGYRVYLVEEKPAIGGLMSRLDKTFPTNDCAMCIVSPRLVDVGRHLNIEIMTGTTVKEVTGEAGRFQVKVHRAARYIQSEKCTGCGDCAAACPVEVTSHFDAGLAGRKAVYKLYPQAVPASYAIEKLGTPPCRAACPAGVNVQGYVQLIKVGKFKEAFELIYRDNPFPAACGRVCTHPCQEACHRGKIDQPLNIMHLKRLAADIYYSSVDEEPSPHPVQDQPVQDQAEGIAKKKVAVIGAGPAGLTAARELALRGYPVMVYEALPVAGGMMRVGIPEYRLPKKWVNLEVARLVQLGIEIRYNMRLGRELSVRGLLDSGYAAVFLAVGAHRGVRPGVPGEELEGVTDGVSILRAVNLGENVSVGKKVLVIGGGNTAMDCARTSLRLGAESVCVVYRRTEEEMPALPDEVAEAQEEGITFITLASPKAFTGRGGQLNSVELIRNRLDQPGPDGRRRPVPVAGSEFSLEADMVILAVGQEPELDFLVDTAIEKSRGGVIKVDPDTLETGLPGVFAGGDAATGPKTVIEAVAAGKTAAESIHRYLTGKDLRAEREFKIPQEKIVPLRYNKDEVPPAPAVKVEYCEPLKRAKTFEEVAVSYLPGEAQREAERCLNCGVCSECLECVRACIPGAVEHGMKDEEVEIEVGAVILNPGLSTYDPSELEYYGYGRLPNVVTSIQFERILSASGPYQGHLVRPSDGEEPRRIAWIQCVGSRNERIDKGYCSSVCCMYAIKQAVIAKEHAGSGLDTTIFYMDMRCFGKDFERYYNRAEAEQGVRFVRSRIFGIEEAGDENGRLQIRYADQDGSIRHERFDIVVLSVGLRPAEGSEELAKAAGVELDPFGFCKTDGFWPGVTSRPGVFAGGAFTGPKDIPETVVEASATAGYASRLLAPARWSMTRTKEYPPERPVENDKLRIGVFVCNCGINIGSVVDVPAVVKYAAELKDVAHAGEFMFTCSQDSIERIKDAIVNLGLNRVVVASCTPRTHAPLFQNALREAGLNPHLYEHVNIREHSSWVHRDQPVQATAKARDLVRMAVAKVRLLKPLASSYTEVEKGALVVGGGAAGMAAAALLAEQGFKVHLVEKSNELGGNLKKLRHTLDGSDPAELLKDLTARVENNPAIEVLTGAEVVDASGYPGKYTTTVRVGEQDRRITHGAAILATGAREARPRQYLYGEHPGVVTQSELEELLGKGSPPGVKTVVMIQCVGSREEGRPYCSRICCSQAVKNALKIKELDPGARVYVIYRDVRVYGLNERYYTEARQKGVIFIRYGPEEKPQVKAGPEGLTVEVRDPILDERLAINADLVALAGGVEPNEDSEKLSRLFKVPLNADGFFLEAHLKLKPVDFSAEGLYLCGLAHSPKLVGEALGQAGAVAMRAVSFLAAGRRESVPIVAVVNRRWCAGCGQCVKVCGYGARNIDDSGVATVQESLCQGCGACVAACPNGATQQNGFTKNQILAALNMLAAF